MSNKAKPGVEDGEKQSPTDLQEIQLQMNATTDEVNRTAVTSTIRPIIIHGVASLRFVLARRWAGLACMHLKHNSCRGRRTPHPSVICVKLLRAVVNQRRADLQRRTLATQRLRAAFRVPSASGAVCPRRGLDPSATLRRSLFHQRRRNCHGCCCYDVIAFPVWIFAPFLISTLAAEFRFHDVFFVNTTPDLAANCFTPRAFSRCMG